MWRINHIEFENFISFKEAQVDILQNICTLIYGVNMDNAKQKNNGTGKSSLIEAIAFGLTGEPLRGVDKAEEIINDHADSASVYVELSNDYDKTMLTIQRTIYRKQPQQIECHKYDEQHHEIEKELTVQPSVLEYNKFILNEIGLTKDDIYNNYILSNQRYKSFFDASDKQKKAMINRFSGADAVDLAIEALQNDKKPVEDKLNKAKEAKIAVDSKIEVIEQQIADVDNKKEEYAQEREQRIQSLQDKIAEQREQERNNKEQIKKANERLDKIDEVGGSIEDFQNTNLSLDDTYHQVKDLMDKYQLSAIKDYVSMTSEIKLNIKTFDEHKSDCEKLIIGIKERLTKAQSALTDARESYDKMKSENDRKDEDAKYDLKDIQKDIDDTQKEIDENVTKVKELKDKSDDCDKEIRSLRNMLHGAIVCPKCKHEFFLNENISVDEAKKDLKKLELIQQANSDDLTLALDKSSKLESKKRSFEKEKDDTNKEIDDRANKLRQLHYDVNDANSVVSKVSDELAEHQQHIKRLETQIEGEQERIKGMRNNMLQEALDIIDNTIDKGERYVKNLKESNTGIEAAIEALEKSIETVRNSNQSDLIKSLDKTLGELKTSQSDADKKLSEVQKEFDKYTVQENHFVEFRSYLANKKVEAISGVTNYFLKLIGSDLRVEMLGFKRLKNGSIRDKITVNLLRNGENCGSFGKYSAGERARVNLASILGLQKLTNDSADPGKGLGLVILDEILEASDTTGIEASCKALNRLGITSLLVTQNPIAGDGVNTLVVTKENGISTINQE